MQAPFVTEARLTAISLAYRNNALIADQVLPRIPVDSDQFKWTQFTKEDAFTIPDTKVGRRSAPNEIDWTASQQSGITQDYGLEDVIPYADIARAQAAQAIQGVTPVDPQARSTELLTELVLLDREQRAANLVFALGTYPAANKVTLAGVSQWSDTANSDPVKAIQDALDGMLIRPNVGVFGRATWSALRRHPKITAAVFPLGGNAAVAGAMASADAVAQLFELDRIVIGEGFVNTAKKGQPAAFARVWGKHAAFLRLSSSPNDVTFGFTAQWGARIAGTIANDPNAGLRGGTRVRVGEAVKEVVAASDAGYFFQNAVA